MIRDEIPNLFRLYLNPYVAQACYCLTQYVVESWRETAEADGYQVFLANSEEEALSGAVKLARYTANEEQTATSGIIFDPRGRFEHFCSTHLAGQGKIEFIPGVNVLGDGDQTSAFLRNCGESVGFVVVPHEVLRLGENPVTDALRERWAKDARRPLLIAYTNQKQLARQDEHGLPAPDIVVFDESLVNHQVPFGAFVAAKRLYERWNRRGMSTFHSTTFQPNTISTLHFMVCLRARDPSFVARHTSKLDRIERDPQYRLEVFHKFYSPSLAMLTRLANFTHNGVRASGHYVSMPGKRIFDGVAGVACSIRGHNPAEYLAGIERYEAIESCREELAQRLHDLTGLPHWLPAVSGASAVEQALKIGLVCRYPNDYVLALRGGFGGKTLFALTGTWKPFLKSALTPLYPNVVYVDPFARDAVSELEAVFRKYPIGLVQVELVQGVGGVRAIPDAVLQCLAKQRAKSECLLFVDEVQTGMFRTGSFVRSADLGIQPDLLTVGKGTSDMMFPSALTLFSDAVAQTLTERQCRIPERIREKYGYDVGMRTVLDILRFAEDENLAHRVRSRSELCARLLREKLKDCRLVRDVRCFGLLVGIELDDARVPHRWFKQLLSKLYLLAMLNHSTFPLLVGFCQYETNVLKLTPPLSVSEEEIRRMCATISSVLHKSLGSVAVASLLDTVLRPRLSRVFSKVKVR